MVNPDPAKVAAGVSYVRGAAYEDGFKTGAAGLRCCMVGVSAHFKKRWVQGWLAGRLQRGLKDRGVSWPSRLRGATRDILHG